MNPSMIVKVAILAILRNKTRAFLTCLGIIAGIAAVIIVLAIGKGSQTMMVRQLSSMGNNLLMLFPERHNAGPVHGGMGQGQTMTAEDGIAIKKELSHLVQAVSPMVRANMQMIRQDRNWSSSVQGVSTDYTLIRSWDAEDGR